MRSHPRHFPTSCDVLGHAVHIHSPMTEASSDQPSLGNSPSFKATPGLTFTSFSFFRPAPRNVSPLSNQTGRRIVTTLESVVGDRCRCIVGRRSSWVGYWWTEKGERNKGKTDALRGCREGNCEICPEDRSEVHRDCAGRLRGVIRKPDIKGPPALAFVDKSTPGLPASSQLADLLSRHSSRRSSPRRSSSNHPARV